MHACLRCKCQPSSVVILNRKFCVHQSNLSCLSITWPSSQVTPYLSGNYIYNVIIWSVDSFNRRTQSEGFDWMEQPKRPSLWCSFCAFSSVKLDNSMIVFFEELCIQLIILYPISHPGWLDFSALTIDSKLLLASALAILSSIYLSVFVRLPCQLAFSLFGCHLLVDRSCCKLCFFNFWWWWVPNSIPLN